MVRRTSKSRRKKRSGAGLLLLVVVLLGLFAAAGVGWLIFMPYGPQTETFVELEPGSSTPLIGRKLEDAGVVRSQFAFDLLRLVERKRLKAGEYRFDHPVPVTEVYERIARGDVYTISLTIPEGSNIFDVAARVQQAGFGTREAFLLAATQQTGLVADIDPAAKTLEGYLFPDTYRFPRKATPAHIAAAMVRRFRAVADQLGLKKNVHNVVTVASLVERETAIDNERPLVASVFENRLTRKMPLMTDPAVIYGLELQNRWTGDLHKSDLAYNTAYNTYLHQGLPPGPVANPGVRSLRAAMSPASTDYLYFVAAGADAQGASLFSSTLDEHNRNVSGYRKAVKKAGAR
jgi:UPF0755 protein